jgi:LPS-assembly protein
MGMIGFDISARSRQRPRTRHLLAALTAAAFLFVIPSSAHAQANPDSPLGNCRVRWEASNTGPFDLGKEEGFYLHNVHIVCDEATIFADEVRWKGNIVTARGHVVFEHGDLHMTAERIEIDKDTKLGTFYNASGWARLSNPSTEPNPFGRLEPDVQFSADKIERVGARTYKLTRGWYSTCAQPNPRWQITHSSGSIVLDEHVIAWNAMLKVKGVPVFYIPVIYYPLGEDERSTGFLMPQYNSSTINGQGFTNAFFLVLGRNQDATFYHTWFSKGGQSVSTEYRYVSAPGSSGQAQFTVLDKVSDQTKRRYIAKGSMNQRFGRRVNLIGRVNYTSDQATQQLYQQNLYEASQRDRFVSLTLAATKGRYVFTAIGDVRDWFQDLVTAQRQGRAPLVSLNLVELPIGRSRVTFGMTNEAAYFIKQDDITRPETDRSHMRFDVAPTIRAPLSSLLYLSVSAAANLRYTYWSDSQIDPTDPTIEPGTPTLRNQPLDRLLAEVRTDIVGPTFAKIWTPKNTGYADRFKHEIEPRVSISWLSPFDQLNNVLQIDWIDTMVGGTTTINYALVNRVKVRRHVPGGKGPIREILSVTVSQSYYTNALAAAFDPNYHSTNVSPYSPIQITATTAPGDNVNARFQMYIDSTLHVARSYTASTSLLMGRSQLGLGWSKRMFIPGLPGYNTPESATHFLNWAFTTRSSGGRVAGSYTANLDLRQGTLLQQRMGVTLNAQCCGMTVDYQILGQGQIGTQTLPADRRFGISFSLAGLGSFSNPFGSFGDNSGRR